MAKEILTTGKYRRFVCENGWEYIERLHSNQVVVMLAVTDDQKLILVEQFRIPVGHNMIELPAGLVHDQPDNRHESMVETARRELIEETGYDGREFIQIAEDPANASLATDMLTIYLVRGLTKVAQGGGDENESIIVHEVPLSDIDLWIQDQKNQGKFVDFKILAGLYYLKQQNIF